MIKVSILGATGYTGLELVRILYQHPQVEIVGLGTQSYAGQPFDSVYPHFRGFLNQVCKNISDPDLIDQADVIFLALPHGHSTSLVEAILNKGKKVIDLGADFRLNSPETYQKWYKAVGPSQELLQKAVYGLPELNREEIKKAQLIANPGCYPTTVILGLAPLLKEKLIDLTHIIVDSKSGTSGAGRGLRVPSLYCEVNENFKAYGFPAHRHTPEIEQELSFLAHQEIKITFTPHLIPMTRGMLSTIYTKLNSSISIQELASIYQKQYDNEKFIRVLPEGEYPQTKWVSGTNFCDLGLSLDESTGRLVVISAIDNLVKGASGQAVQNMNIMCGIDESCALTRIALFP